MFIQSKRLIACTLSAIGLLAAVSARAAQPTGVSAGWIGGNLEIGIAHAVASTSWLNFDDGRSLALSSERVRSSNHYQREAGAASAAVGCGMGLSCVANYSVDARTGTNSRDNDMETAHGDVGLTKAWAGSVYGLRMGNEQWRIGGQPFGQMRSVTADAVRNYGEQVKAYAAVTSARLSHPGENAILDSNYRAFTGSLRYATISGWQSAFALQATLSSESNLERDRWLDARGTVLRATWQVKPMPSWDARAALTAQARRYGDIDPDLGVQRMERFDTFELNLAHQLDKRLQLRLEYISARHQSSVPGLGNAWSSIGVGLQWQLD